MWFAGLCALLGGFLGVAIGYSICTMKQKTPEGEFFTYDLQTRKEGKLILVTGLVVLLALAFVFILFNLTYENNSYRGF